MPRESAMTSTDTRQTTLAASARFDGVGLHSGLPVTMAVHPAPANEGITFFRADLDGAAVTARWDAVEETPLHTRLTGAEGVHVLTVEHLMAALAGLGIGNARISLTGPEVPIMDGSSAPFVRGLMAAGLRRLAAPQPVIRILREVAVTDGSAWARLSPATGLQIDFTIEFPEPAIGRQAKVLNLANGAFVRELASSRTFCRLSDVSRMAELGLGKGGSTGNAVVVDGDRVLTPGGLRHPDEPVRHKMLDALGDLALAGAPILGRYTGHRAGHALTNRLLRALFADRAAWRIAPCDPRAAARLPGAGVTAADLAAVA
jgi:UDP-3-O-[3-hydroxymyristoyl] N-acetylglucosamine deacetylase